MLTNETEWNEFQHLWKKNNILDKLTKQELTKLREGTVLTSFKKGSHVHSPDAPCQGLLQIKSGRLRVYLLSDEGREITMYYIGEGELCILSASCVLDAIEFPVFIDAVEDTSVYQVTSTSFRSLAEENVYLKNFGYQQAIQRFSDAMWSMQQILFRGMFQLLQFRHHQSVLLL